MPRTGHPGHRSVDPELTRAPATAKIDAGDDSGHPKPNRCHHSTRTSARVPQMPSAGHLVAGGGIPQPAAASGLADVTSPVGLTPLTRGFDLPSVTDAWANPH